MFPVEYTEMRTRKRREFVVAMVAALALPAAAGAQTTYFWDRPAGDPGNWSDTANWDPNGEPTLNDPALINNGGTAQITQTGEQARYLQVVYTPSTLEMYGGDLTLDTDGGTLSLKITNSGTVNIYGGDLASAGEVRVGETGGGTLAQTGGTHQIGTNLVLASHALSAGTYTLSGGSLSTANIEYVGYGGTGTFNQSGGTNTAAGNVFLGRGGESSGTYNLSAGQLSVGAELRVGYGGIGTFTQTGGTNTVGDDLWVPRSDMPGTYEMSGGQLSVGGRLFVGPAGGGTFDITDPTAQITLWAGLTLGQYSQFQAVPGSTIHMTGAGFDNYNYDEADLPGLSNLELIFEGGTPSVDTFEAASVVDGGFDDNFALGALTLGGADVGLVQLVDVRNNGNRGVLGFETLFVHELSIGAGSELDVNGLRLYVEGDVEALLDGWIADGRLFDSTLPPGVLDAVYVPAGDWTVVPDPATLWVLALGGLMLSRRRQRGR